MTATRSILSAVVFAASLSLFAADEKLSRPHPATNPTSPLMLAGSWVPEDSQQIDFDKLPRVASEHAVVSDVHAPGSPGTSLDKQRGGVNQHNYLAHFAGKFWAMWSDGPGIEDRVGQRVKFATSIDGLRWSTPKFLTPEPPNSGPDSPHYGTRSAKGFRYISRGFWKRDGELLALASLDEAAGFFGPSLALHAFRLNAADETWTHAGVVFKDAINNFAPLKLRTGDWMMSRRAHDYKTSGVSFLLGGTKALDQWESFPVFGSSSELKAEEPDWWILPDQNLMAVFRDNRGSGFVYRAFSTDDGRTWSQPVRTNFPDATSKMSGLQLSDGRYVLVSNPKPKKRDPLTLSISDDGMVFTKMVYLVGGRHIDYPHVIEHEGSLFIAFAGGKQSVEVLKVKLADVDAVRMPSPEAKLPRTAETFEIDGHKAFLYAAPAPAPGQPWLWYAPTLKGISIVGRKMYFEGLMRAGISIAGYDLGEVRGAPTSTEKFHRFYEEMVRRGWSPKPILLGQSRGGMMTLAWAFRHPDKVRAWVGIYPVCNLASWSLKNSKPQTLADFAMPEAELVARLTEFNPVDNLRGLLAHKVPMFVVHGDSDLAVPYDDNTRILKERYEAGGGAITVKLIVGEGHKATPAFFECQELLDFVLRLP